MNDAGTNTDRADRCEPLVAPKRRRCWWRILLYLVIFASGGVVGVGTTLLVIRNRALHAVHHPDEMPQLIAERMRWALSLSDEQEQEVERILRTRQTAIQQIRREFQPQVEEELDRLEEQVSEVLTEEQRVKWRKRFDHLRRTWLPEPPPAD